MPDRRVRIQPMTATENEMRAALDRMLAAALERPGATIGSKITVHPRLPDEAEPP